ncbi:MAG TPA: biotin--[acetyl-CoA-carboxylase] ligase [Gemmatimonadales bacterium]|nr:biotin--[acetyl-CoA-carboxylase] ligase [Gemmatimonadales bacterium]
MSVDAAPVVRLASVGSTLDVLHELAQRGAPHGTLVVAEEQLQGRGRRGAHWHSPRGGLWLSLLHRPLAQPTAEVLSLRVGMAVAEGLDRLGLAPPLRLKWPNDLILADRKLGGVLCEGRWHGATLGWIAIGLGINVRNPIPPEVADRAGRLADLAPGIELEAVLDAVREALAGLPAAGGERLTEAELTRFAGRDWLRGRRIREPEAGVADGIDRDGALRVRRADGSIVPVRAGRVEIAE